MPKFRCWVEDSPLAPIVHLQGDVDLITAPEFRECMRGTASSTTHNGYVMVDLSELEYIDGGGLRALEEGRELCQQRGRALVLVAPPPHIERILEMVQLTDRLPVLNSVEALSLRAQLNGDQPDKNGEDDVTAPPPGREPHGERGPKQKGRQASDE